MSLLHRRYRRNKSQIVACTIRTFVIECFQWIIINYVLFFQMKAAYRAFDAFCELPEDVRIKYDRNASSNHGYVKPGPSKYDLNDKKLNIKYIDAYMYTQQLIYYHRDHLSAHPLSGSNSLIERPVFNYNRSTCFIAGSFF